MLYRGLVDGNRSTMTHVLVICYEYEYGVDGVRVFSSEENLREWVNAHPRPARSYYELWIVPMDGGTGVCIGEVG